MPDDSSRRTSPRAFLSRSQTLPGAPGLGSTHLSSQRRPSCGSGLRNSRERYAPIRRLRPGQQRGRNSLQILQRLHLLQLGELRGAQPLGQLLRCSGSCIFPQREPGVCVAGGGGAVEWGEGLAASKRGVRRHPSYFV